MAKRHEYRLNDEQRALVEEHITMAYSIAFDTYMSFLQKFDFLTISLEDMKGMALEYLCICAYLYDETKAKGAKFSTYAYKCIKMELITDIHETNSPMKLPRIDHIKKWDVDDATKEREIKNVLKMRSYTESEYVSMNQPVEGAEDLDIGTLVTDGENAYDDFLDKYEETHMIKKAFSSLTDRQKMLVEQFYIQEKTQSEIARGLKGTEHEISQVTISKELKRALNSMKEALGVA